MNTLQLSDSFEPYYAGRKSPFASRKVPRAKPDFETKHDSLCEAGKETGKPEAVSDEKR
jgi:hypothetical protein